MNTVPPSSQRDSLRLLSAFYLARDSQEQATVLSSVYITDIFMTYSAARLKHEQQILLSHKLFVSLFQQAAQSS